jgi:hypothetical protein
MVSFSNSTEPVDWAKAAVGMTTAVVQSRSSFFTLDPNDLDCSKQEVNLNVRLARGRIRQLGDWRARPSPFHLRVAEKPHPYAIPRRIAKRQTRWMLQFCDGV